MRMSELLLRTRKEAPADAELQSHRLLVRAGYVQRVGAGIYSLTPLGLRALRRMEAVVREEMESIGAQEVLLPLVQPAEAWQRTGRYRSIDDALVRFPDRTGHPHVLAMTHEESATALVADIVDSYRQLPLLLFQIQLKFRDEPRPRGGLIRLREFVMKDGYSFHDSEDDLDRCYEAVAAAYRKIFTRLALPVLRVSSDSGIMGGRSSHEYMLRSPLGEDRLLTCTCGYAANSDAAELQQQARSTAPQGELHRVATPGAHTIAALCEQLGCRPEQTIKSVFFEAGEKTLVALVRGNREVCLPKLAKSLGEDVRPLSPEESRARGLIVGYTGPVGLQVQGPLRIVLDHDLEGAEGLVAGANAEDAHLVGVSIARDVLGVDIVADIALAREGDPCPVCGRPLAEERGIELGNIFKLGTRYSAALGALATGPDGRAAPIVMGSYGIGITRLLAAVVEEHHDAQGIVWPLAAAPYPFHLITAGEGEDVRAAAEDLYLQLGGSAVLFDDRSVSPGVKFKDADLLGMPLRVTIGARSLASGGVELRRRKGGEAEVLPISDAASALHRAAHTAADQ
ncbi:MAG: proline--tRNA ligase [Thermaerobacter sp.]|nr:proline--tRNA ligase [Thermaerobacter sp.]